MSLYTVLKASECNFITFSFGWCAAGVFICKKSVMPQKRLKNTGLEDSTSCFRDGKKSWQNGEELLAHCEKHGKDSVEHWKVGNHVSCLSCY